MTPEQVSEHHCLCEAKKIQLVTEGIRGPWNNEPNRLNWKYRGMDLMLARNPSLLNWCGYVGIKPDHPLYGVKYGSEVSILKPLVEKILQRPMSISPSFAVMLDALVGQGIKASPDRIFDVHGGITYSDYCGGHICHIDDTQDVKTFWYGFDCGHCDDMVPATESMYRSLACEARRDVYRDLGYAKDQSEKLADQLAELAAVA